MGRPLLQAIVNLFGRQYVLDVIEHGVFLAEATNTLRAHRTKLVMGHGDNNAIIRTFLRLGDNVESVFLLRFLSVHPGIVHIYRCAIRFQLFLDIDNLGVAKIRAVFLERQPKNQQSRSTVAASPWIASS